MSILRALSSLLIPLLLAVPAAAQVRPPVLPGSPDSSPHPAEEEVQVTYLANAGFLLRSGKYSVLIDAFLKEPSNVYAALPPETFVNLVQARPPFDGFVLALVSHNHADHFQARGAEKFLTNNKQAQLISSPQVIATLKASARDYAAIQHHVTPVRPPQTLMQEEMSIEFLALAHTGAENREVQNLGHLITMGGVKILHVGDAEPTLENFAPYGLAAKKIDVAIVPYWYFGSEAGGRVLAEEIQARTLIACHIPPKEFGKFSAAMKENHPEVLIFENALESRTFRPAPPAEKPGEKSGG